MGEEWEEVDAKLLEAAAVCKKKVANLPRGQKGKAYRQCIKEILGRL